MSIWDKRDAVGVGQPFEMFGVRKICVSDDHGVDVKMGEIGNAFVDCAIETAPGLPKHIGAKTRCPFSDCGVIAPDPDVERFSSADHGGCHRFG